MLMSGPPGIGKSMIATRNPCVLLKKTLAEPLETTKIHRISG